MTPDVKPFDKWYELKGSVSHVLIRGNEIVVLGTCNDGNDEEHNCDYMGCTSVMCVLYRGWLYGKEVGVSVKEFSQEDDR